MKNSPVVSIIIPTYNRIDLIYDSIKSVINQTYKNIEIVIIDDNSTEYILSFLNANFPDINFKYQKNTENRGVSYSRNKGIELSTGDYISFLDSDDIIKELKIELLVRQAINTGADYVYAGWVWKDFESGKIRKTRKPDEISGLIDGLPRWCYNIVPELVKSEVVKKNMFNPEIKSYELFDFVVRIFKSYKVAYIPEIVSVFRDHTGERTSSLKEEKVNAVNLLFNEHYEFLKKEKKFASQLKLSQGIYDWETLRRSYSQNFLEAIRLNIFNFKAYYHFFRTGLHRFIPFSN